MHLWRTFIAAGLFVAFASPAAPIYKWTDASGVVHYSDQPVPGAQKITVDVDVVPAVPAAPEVPPASSGAQPASVPYTQFVIDSPTREQSFFSADVPVHLTVQPALRTDHALSWSLNGKTLEAYTNSQQFTLADLPRGEFTLTATVVDPATNETLNSASVTFYEHRPSVLNPYHRPH